MFDGLRSDSSNSSFDEPVEFFPEETPPAPAPQPVQRKKLGKFLGLTAQQRFILAVMLMFAICTLGAMCMFVFGKFVLP